MVQVLNLQKMHCFVGYRTRANKGRADYSKIIFSAVRLSHKKDIKKVC